jgi:hypothetical protein
MKATKIVVEFEDGSTAEIPAAGVGAIYLDEKQASAAARRVRPKTDPPGAAFGDTCYFINGVIVCP